MLKKQPKDDWQTPQYILDKVDEFYSSHWLDPCPANHEIDGLSLSWFDDVYVNPPFSNYLAWAKHGLKQSGDQIWICHHDHSTQRFQILADGATLCLLKDRVRFIDPATGEPGKSPEKCQTLIYRGNRVMGFEDVFSPLGSVYHA